MNFDYRSRGYLTFVCVLFAIFAVVNLWWPYSGGDTTSPPRYMAAIAALDLLPYRHIRGTIQELTTIADNVTFPEYPHITIFTPLTNPNSIFPYVIKKLPFDRFTVELESRASLFHHRARERDVLKIDVKPSNELLMLNKLFYHFADPSNELFYHFANASKKDDYSYHPHLTIATGVSGAFDAFLKSQAYWIIASTILTQNRKFIVEEIVSKTYDSPPCYWDLSAKDDANVQCMF